MLCQDPRLVDKMLDEIFEACRGYDMEEEGNLWVNHVRKGYGILGVRRHGLSKEEHADLIKFLWDVLGELVCEGTLKKLVSNFSSL